PALQASRPNLIPALREGRAGDVGRSERLRSVLVVTQVAVSMLLLVASGLVFRGLAAAQAKDLGYSPGRIATFGLNLSMHGLEAEQAHDFLERLRGRVEALPGVESASLAKRVPLMANYHANNVLPDSRSWGPEDSGHLVDVTWADERYFTTLDVPIVRGRGIEATDMPGAGRVAVVSQAAAAVLWPGEEALDRRFRVGDSEGAEVRVVGISSDYTVRAVGEAPRPMVHYAWAQRPSASAHILARARAADGAALVPELRRLVSETDPSLALMDAMTLETLAGVTLYPVRTASVLLGIFAFLGLFLATVGLYAIVAYAARARQREMGVRVALGATPRDVVSELMGRGMVLVLVGCALGLTTAVLASQALSGVLYGRSPLDPLAFLGAAATLLTVALSANAVPAARAAVRDPLAALREE
ncbi:MAG: ABC transporter permease, partial [Holophagales bacterium]|nr:ABC transporter permease [Holophagales bacterium]